MSVVENVEASVVGAVSAKLPKFFLEKVELSDTQIRNCRAILFHFMWHGVDTVGDEAIITFANEIKNIIEKPSLVVDEEGEYKISFNNIAFVDSSSVNEVIDCLASLQNSKMNFRGLRRLLIEKIKKKVEHAYENVLFGMLDKQIQINN